MHLYYISDEQRMVMELARSIAREKIAPVAAHHDETETYPEEPDAAPRPAGADGHLAAGGLWRQRHGRARGRPRGRGDRVGVRGDRDQLGRDSARRLPHSPGRDRGRRSAGTCRASRRASARRLLALGARRGLRRGARLRTTAVRRGDRYVLNGTKLWCSNGSHAGVITLFATVDPGKGAERHHGIPRRAGISRASPSASRSARWGSARRRPSRSISRTARSPWRTAWARRARASGSPCGRSTTRGP